MSAAIQQAQLEKEEARIRCKREANERRTERFLNARMRTIGLDVAALDEQVAEKRRNNQSDMDNEKLERIRAKEIDRILEQAAAEENAMRKFQMEELKKDWAEKSYLNTQRQKPLDYEPEKFGPSSFQVFDGEDTMAEERDALKKDQMRRWTQEQVAEHAMQKQREKDEDMYIADMLKQIDYVREQAEVEEKGLRKSLNREVNEENARIAEELRMRRATAKNDAYFKENGDALDTSLPLSISTAALATDDGKVIRKDMFRGYTPAQRRKLLQENETLLEIKRSRDAAERQLEQDWAVSQSLQQRMMEQANYEEQELRRHHLRQTHECIAQQREEEAERKRKEKQDRMGAISADFFNNFGKSCR